jgi:hypothetical protein
MLIFKDTVRQTIEEIIRNVFEDDETAETIFQYLNKIGTNTPDSDARIITDALPKIFGSGSVIIEDLILETLYAKYNLDLVWKKDYTFADYVLELKKLTTE